jgi:catalase
MPASTTPPAIVAELVKTMRTLAGAHPGFRAAHAKGIVAAGTFRPSGAASRVTRASHLQNGPVTTIVRFSNSSGVPKFLGSHPGGAAFIGRLMQRPVPASHGQTSYHAEHAFLFVTADGTRRYGRYHWTPEAGEVFLTPEDGAKRGPDFLREELTARVRTGPVGFRLSLQLAADGDPTDDPTAVWPDSRERVELGRLEVPSLSRRARPTNGAWSSIRRT